MNYQTINIETGYWRYTRTDERLAEAKFRRWRNEDGNYYVKDHFACPSFLWRGARYYDSEIGRWLQACPPESRNTERRRVDPLGEIQQGWTPYHYSYNNPLKFTDPTGMIPKFNSRDELYNYLTGNHDGESGNNGNSNKGKSDDDDAPTTGDPSIDYILGQLFGLYKQTAANTETTVENLPQNIVEGTSDVADFVYSGSTIGAAFGVIVIGAGALTGNFALAKAGVRITSYSFAIGTESDVVSTVTKGVDAIAFDGSPDAFYHQALSTSARVISGRLVNSATARVVTRTGLTVLSIGASGRFISNSKGYGAIAISDATKVIINSGL